jgi:O-antigen ligase
MFVSGEERGMRIVVGEGDPNLQARQLGLGLILGLSILKDYSGRGQRRALCLALVVAACALGITGSRGATVAVLGGLAVWGWARPNRALAAALMLALSLGLGATEFRGDLRSPVGSVLSGEREDISSGRDAIWANTFDLLMQSPFLGVGAAAVPAAYDAARDRRMAHGGLHSKRSRDPHSLYLQLLVGLGPLGLLLLLMAGGTLLREARGHPERSAALAVLAFLALSATTQSTLELKDFWLGFAWVALLLRE